MTDDQAKAIGATPTPWDKASRCDNCDEFGKVTIYKKDGREVVRLCDDCTDELTESTDE